MHALEQSHPHTHARPHGAAILLDAVARRRLSFLFVLGAGLTGVGVYLDPNRMAAQVLIAAYLWLALALAGAVFLALQYVTKAGWSIVFRRVPESMAATLPYAATVFLVALLLTHHWVYPWSHPVAVVHGAESHAVSAGKALWLHPVFVLSRAAVYLLVWVVLARRLYDARNHGNDSATVAIHGARLRAAAQFLVVFALTFSLAGFDWFMSLDPAWVSTIYAVYGFGGLFSSGIAAIILLTIWLKRRGAFHHAVNENHLHDLGKLQLAFATFWAYLWLSQYLLIWYANMPEETAYYMHRHVGSWAVVEGVNLTLNWILPFFLLLPRCTKRNERALRAVAGLVLVGSWIDLLIRVLPALSPDNALLLPMHLGPLTMLVPVMLLAVNATLHRAPLVPIRDPLLAESLHLHQ